VLILASSSTSLHFVTYQEFTIVAANRRRRLLWRSWFLVACGVALVVFMLTLVARARCLFWRSWLLLLVANRLALIVLWLAIVTAYRRLRCGVWFFVACLVAVIICGRAIITTDRRFGLRFLVASNLTLFVPRLATIAADRRFGFGFGLLETSQFALIVCRLTFFARTWTRLRNRGMGHWCRRQWFLIAGLLAVPLIWFTLIARTWTRLWDRRLRWRLLVTSRLALSVDWCAFITRTRRRWVY
jgi:hypothetical protein